MNKFMSRIREFENMCWAALLVAGAASFAACSSDDAAVEKQPETPATGKYTLTVTASKGDAGTRALTIDETVTPNELNAYWDGTETVTLTSGNESVQMIVAPDATDNTKATLTATLTTAPANGAELTMELCSASISGQEGTLAYIAEHCDYATATTTATVSGTTITCSDATFTNQNAIARFALYHGSTLISPTTLKVSISHSNQQVQAYLASIGKDSYTFTIPAETYTTNGDGVLYFALPSLPASVTIQGVSVPLNAADFTLAFIATTANDVYAYIKTGYPFSAGKFYDIAVKMNPLVDLTTKDWDDYLAKDGDILTGEGHYNSVTIPEGATVTLFNASINAGGTPGIECYGDATIILEGSNTVTGSYGDPGIFVPELSTLTIKGSGSLRAEGRTHEFGGNKRGGAGIGGRPVGGNVIIEGGSITAIGGYGSPGIGGSYDSNHLSDFGPITFGPITFGDITIKNTVTSVTATKGEDAPYCIGPCKDGSCGIITFGDEEVYGDWGWYDWFNDYIEEDGSVNVGGLIVTPNEAGETWTLTPAP